MKSDNICGCASKSHAGFDQACDPTMGIGIFQRRSPASWKSSCWWQRGSSSFAFACSWQRRFLPHWRRPSSCFTRRGSSWIVSNESSSKAASSLPEHEPSARSRARRRHLPTRSASESDFDARKRPNEPSGLLTQSAPESGFDARPGTRQLQRPNETSATSGPFHRQLGMKRDASWHGSPDKCEAGKYAEGSAGTCSDCDAEGPPESTQQMVIKWLESSDRCGFQAVSQALLLRDPVAAHSELP